MKYMVLMYADPAATEAMTAAERADVFCRQEALHQDLEGTGEMLNGAGLAHPRDTTTIHHHADGPRPADGPLTDTTDQLTAYYVIDCATPERAREIAERVLDFHVGALEIRPVHDFFGMTES
ncbi:YciI family protein [Streptomyces sp. NBC_00847]|uniref:YciI family protein n=1 Tax=unclassified Streptomyces TaxID=2593676 RepID=UPI00225E552B|nr:YciI family protein [Streptomyces sp. NBC_00847]MCX4885715.1 YciI family protein [Streptomyces sp. NBC_00847]